MIRQASSCDEGGIGKEQGPRDKIKTLPPLKKLMWVAKEKVREEKRGGGGRGGRRGGGGVDSIEPATDAEMEVVALEVAVEEEIEELKAGMVKGTLLDADIDRMQSLFVSTSEHPGDLDRMKHATWAPGSSALKLPCWCLQLTVSILQMYS